MKEIRFLSDSESMIVKANSREADLWMTFLGRIRLVVEVAVVIGVLMHVFFNNRLSYGCG